MEINWVDLPAGLTRRGQENAGSKSFLPRMAAASRSTMSQRAAARFSRDRGLAVFNLSHGRETRKGLDGQPVNYFVYELKRKLTAEKAGTYSLGPAVVKGSFVDGMEGGSYTARRLVAVAPAVPVEVREVPVAAACDILRRHR